MNKVAYAILCMVILAGIFVVNVSAVKPDGALWSLNKEWVVANGVDTAAISVNVFNSSNGTLNGVPVLFQVNNSVFGTLNPTQAILQNGLANSTFIVDKKSGIANISAIINYKINDTDPDEPYQTAVFSNFLKIDHDTPYVLASYTVPPQITVGSVGDIRLAYTDQWGNPVDNRRETEELYFYISSPGETAKFVNASAPGTALQQYVDSTGNFRVQMIASEQPGTNIILAHPVAPGMGDLPDKYFYIQAIANGTPCSIEQYFDPEGYLGQPPKQYADGISLFQIIYTLRDRYGNGIMNSPVQVSTTIPGEEKTVFTNQYGQAMLTYGPKESIGKITITARSLLNETVDISKQVWFISQEANDMQFTANPETMPSRDVEGAEPAELRAKVIDENGNPVQGETVTFSLGTPTYEGTYNITMNPELSSLSAITNEDGYALVDFYPGAFTTNWEDLFFEETASGAVQVTAHWENVTRDISRNHSLTLNWKNYPYLSIEASVSPQTVNVTDTVDVNIKLSGDGWALQPKPIDVLLLLDNSGSMGTTNSGLIGTSALTQSKRAAVTFIDQMEQGKDRVGVIFYDKKTYPDFSVYIPLTYDLTSVKNAISGYSRSSGSGYHTRTRYALYEGIRLMNQWNNRKAIRAIIHMTDGQWSMEGDPLARGFGYNFTFGPEENIPTGLHSIWAGNVVGVTDKFRYFDDLGGATATYGSKSGVPNGQTYDTGTTGWVSDSHETTQNTTTKTTWYFTDAQTSKQNMSVYAKDSNLKVYSIGFTSSANYDNLKLVLSTISNATGAFYQYAPNEAALTTLYSEIAGQLKTEAGVNTAMDLNFDQIEINYETVTMNETYQAFNYVYDPSKSTKIRFHNSTADIVPPYILDQTDDWNDDYRLTFNVGTIKLGQVWEANYTLRIATDGSINIFGPGSTVTFNGGEAFLLLPKTYITGVPGIVTTGVNTSELNITTGDSSTGTDDSGIEYVEWPIYREYTGTYNVTERYYISNDGGMQWILIGETILTPEEANQDGYFRYPKILLPPGIIDFKVESSALDAPGPIIAVPPQSQPNVIPTGTYYIHIR